MAEDGAGEAAYGWVLGRWRGVDEGMVHAECAFEGDEGGVDEFDDDQLGGQQESVDGSHRFLPTAGVLGLGVWAKTSRNSFSSSRASSRSAATASSSLVMSEGLPAAVRR